MKLNYGIELPCKEFPHTVIVNFELFGKVWKDIELYCTEQFYQEYQAGQYRDVVPKGKLLYVERGEDYYGITPAGNGSYIFLDKPAFNDLQWNRQIEDKSPTLDEYNLIDDHKRVIPEVSNKTFTLVGSRETPKDIYLLMRELAQLLLSFGWDGYSGASGFADKQLEQAYFYNYYRNIAQGTIYCFMPWGHFDSLFKFQEKVVYYNTPMLPDYDRAKVIAKEHYDKYNDYDKLGVGAKSMMNRNVYQVLGPELKHKTDITIYWAKPATSKNMVCQGGTNLAVALSEHYQVPTINLYFPWVEQRIRALLNAFKAGKDAGESIPILLSELISDKPMSDKRFKYLLARE